MQRILVLIIVVLLSGVPLADDTRRLRLDVKDTFAKLDKTWERYLHIRDVLGPILSELIASQQRLLDPNPLSQDEFEIDEEGRIIWTEPPTGTNPLPELQLEAALNLAEVVKGLLDSGADTEARLRQAIWAMALKLAKSIDPPSLYNKGYGAKALAEIAAAQAEAGDHSGAKDTFTEALTMAESIEFLHNRANALRDVAAAQANAGDQSGAADTFAKALRAAVDSRPVGARAGVLRNIAVIQARTGDHLGAKKALAEALQAIEAGYFEEDRNEMLADIAVLQAEAGDIDGALTTAKSINSAHERGMALHGIVLTQVNAGHIAEALQTAQMASGIDSTSFSPSALANIASAREKAGDHSGAAATLAQAFQAVQDTDDVYRSQALHNIALAQADVEGIDGAMKTLESVADSDPTNGMAGIAIVKALAGDFAGALETIDNGSRHADPTRALYRVAVIRAEAGDFAGALTAARRISNAYGSRSRVLAEISSAQANAGDQSGAKETFVEALETAKGIDDTYHRDNALHDIAVAAAEMGDQSGASGILAEGLEAAKGIDDTYGRDNALHHIAVAMVERGDIAEALKAAKGIDEALSDIAVAMAKLSLTAD